MTNPTSKPTGVNQLSNSLAESYKNLLAHSADDKLKLIEGIYELGGFEPGLIQLDTSMLVKYIMRRIENLESNLTYVNKFDSLWVLSQLQRSVAKDTMSTLSEVTQNGVKFEDIRLLISKFPLEFGVPKDLVFTRLKEALTPKKLVQLNGLNAKGHELDVLYINSDGQLVIASCSEESPVGHRDLSFNEAVNLLGTHDYEGIYFMTVQMAGTIFLSKKIDENSWSLLSPQNRKGEKPELVYYSINNNICWHNDFDNASKNGGIRVYTLI